MEELLQQIIKNNKKLINDGHVATYIPGLAKINPDQLGISIIDLQQDNKEYKAGDADVKFAIESVSKVMTLALAVLDRGEEVFEKVGIEPTHFAFNSILNMEIRESSKPTNPFINAGAIATTSLVKGKDVEDKVNRILDFMRTLANNQDIHVNEDLYLSERETGDINRSLAYYMEGHGMIEGNVDDILDVYFQQCSIEVTAGDLARMGGVLANGGKAPWNDKQLIPVDLATILKSLMTTCGLYDGSGSFAVNIGIPSKSGVGGGIISAVPGKVGIGIFGPSLDKEGNSIAGIGVLKDLSQELTLNIFK